MQEGKVNKERRIDSLLDNQKTKFGFARLSVSP